MDVYNNTEVKILEEDLDLIDLISNKYFILKQANSQLWDESHNILITNSEWFIISLIYDNKPTISEIAQKANITRQAVHKTIKSLHSKGLVTINKATNNKKSKCLELTPLGEKCFLDNEIIKDNIEQKILDKIGPDKINLFKELLKMEWG